MHWSWGVVVASHPLPQSRFAQNVTKSSKTSLNVTKVVKKITCQCQNTPGIGVEAKRAAKGGLVGGAHLRVDPLPRYTLHLVFPPGDLKKIPWFSSLTVIFTVKSKNHYRRLTTFSRRVAPKPHQVEMSFFLNFDDFHEHWHFSSMGPIFRS